MPDAAADHPDAAGIDPGAAEVETAGQVASAAGADRPEWDALPDQDTPGAQRPAAAAAALRVELPRFRSGRLPRRPQAARSSGSPDGPVAAVPAAAEFSVPARLARALSGPSA